MTTTKKQMLLDAALTLFVANGIDSTSTASIAKLANVANGTLFHHFKSKAALVHTLYLTVKQELSAQISPQKINNDCINEQAYFIWNKAIDWSITNPEKLQFFKQITYSKALSVELRAEVMAQELSFLSQLITIGQQQKIIADYPIDLMLDAAQGLFISSSSFFIDHPQYINNQDYRTSAFKIFLSALSRG
ncbi:MAG: TetR/AcrR family transcriptional regulator [Gammaproteobacteria bacterium]|nr:TetR/AcrR family transcriptional regulator [Gammaproteobacteria bacterium]